MPDTWTARASVATDTAERYAKQLAFHLARKAQVCEGLEGRRVVLDGGTCLLVTSENALELQAEAASPKSLEQVQHVVGSHLERFGQRNEMVVVWTAPTPLPET